MSSVLAPSSPATRTAPSEFQPGQQSIFATPEKKMIIRPLPPTPFQPAVRMPDWYKMFAPFLRVYL